MASIRKRPKKDGTVTYAVLYNLDGKQTSAPFPDELAAGKFRDLVNSVGARRAHDAWGLQDVVRAAPRGMTLGEWLTGYVDQLTGVLEHTRHEYRRYAKRDFAPLAEIPLNKLTSADIAGWVNAQTTSAKTTGNKRGFLAGALNKAVDEGKITSNPCTGIRLPQSEQREMVFLTKDEFRAVYDKLPERHQPLAEFLVSSGCRFSEATALRPSDVDRDAGTVRISRAWKKVPGNGYQLGAPKTPKSRRTINVPMAVLDKLDYSREYLFLNHWGKPIHGHVWRVHVWYPAVELAKISKKPRVHDLRHTCVSWLISAGVSLPAIQAHLGHESIKTTIDRYGHLDRTAGSAVADAIAAALGK